MENTIVPKETAKDTFLHLLSAAMLYLSVIGFITLWWQIINFLVPDKLNATGYGSWIYDTLIWGASALAVAYPVYVVISRIIGADFKTHPAKRESQVRKWLWYLTLFVAAVTIIIDLVTLFFNFLRGDLTTQFLLKLIVILAVTVAVFGYYLWDLKKRDAVSAMPKKLAVAAGAVIFASICYGFFLVGSPAKQRNIRFDEQRAGNLQEIQNFVANYWQQKKKLPMTLDELKTLGYMVAVDPETGRQYEYAATGDLSFKLCAEFKTAVVATAGAATPYNSPYYYPQQGIATTPQNWVHETGRACFDSAIDKDFFTVKAAPAEEVIPVK